MHILRAPIGGVDGKEGEEGKYIWLARLVSTPIQPTSHSCAHVLICVYICPIGTLLVHNGT